MGKKSEEIQRLELESTPIIKRAIQFGEKLFPFNPEDFENFLETQTANAPRRVSDVLSEATN